jgi:hypothetical protein
MKLQIKNLWVLKISWWGYYVSNIGSKDSQKENSVQDIVLPKARMYGVLDVWILFQRITSLW